MSSENLFEIRRGTLVGMVHFPALPGSALHDGTPQDEIARRLCADAAALAEAGFDAIMIQNTGDGPGGKDADPATVAQMAVLGDAIRRTVDIPVGVNVLKNGVETAFAIAVAIGAAFVRIKVYVGAVVGSEGIVEGGARIALEARRRLGLHDVAILADVLDRTSLPLGDPSLVEVADWAIRHGHADALVVTGREVGETKHMLRDLRGVAVETPLLVGGGARPDNVADLLQLADGVIVGAAVKAEPGPNERDGRTNRPRDGQDGGSVSRSEAAAFVEAARRALVGSGR
jgi:membrane complex biogenesis BtpA family protein